VRAGLRWRKLGSVISTRSTRTREGRRQIIVQTRGLASHLKIIGAVELFRDLPHEALVHAHACARIERLPKHARIFEQGARAERAYAVAKGSVRIIQTGSDGGQAIIRFIGSGEMFGTVPLFTDHLLPADAITAEASVVLSWSEADIVVLIGIYPQVSLNVIRVIGTRLIELQDRVRELATQRADQRLARALLRLIRNDGGDEVAFPLRRKDLAEFSGTTLHTASRMLSAWARAGLLTSIGRRILIHDRTALDSLAEGRPLL
jgi:CRP/FNR family transcriptional regulator, nitrogen oxide reductase regulator